ncbi:MAG: HPF/RaiA family ribosome-associated protein [Pirellulaceae bacterium]|nr:HPF/RaiA family ribosome-associated protein [Pirellulaceae bacterium]
MRLCIHTQGVVLPEALRRFASEKLNVALDRLSGSVQEIQLHLNDTNGPNRSGPDKSCRVIVQIHKQKPLVLEDHDSNLGLVIDRITDRLGAAVSRRVDRLRNKQRFSMGDTPLSQE